MGFKLKNYGFYIKAIAQFRGIQNARKNMLQKYLLLYWYPKFAKSWGKICFYIR